MTEYYKLVSQPFIIDMIFFVNSATEMYSEVVPLNCTISAIY